MSAELRSFAFISLLRDEAEARGVADLLEDLACTDAAAASRFLVPGVRGLDFFAAGASQPELDRWWGASVPADALPVYLLSHEEGLPEWLEGIDGIVFVAVEAKDARHYPRCIVVDSDADGAPLALAEAVITRYVVASNPGAIDVFDIRAARTIAGLRADSDLTRSAASALAHPKRGYAPPPRNLGPARPDIPRDRPARLGTAVPSLQLTSAIDADAPPAPARGPGHAAGGLASSVMARARQHRALWPAAAIVLVTVISYNLTLASMYDYLRLQTPLAYLPLLPFFSLGIALLIASRYRGAPTDIRDRQTDLLIGIPLLVIAMVLVIVVPPIASTYYWSNRPDVLSMAFLVAGLVTLFYGVTWLWRVKASILFLALTWPALYLNLLPGVMKSFSDATNSTLARVVHDLPLGVSLTADPGVLSVHQPSGDALTVSVGTACSGADSVLGFLLIGGVILAAVGPGRGRKLLWLVSGLVLTFAVNVLRLTSILALVAAGHPSLALGGYHEVIGLILFAIVLTLMILLLPHFRLHPRVRAASGAAPSPASPAPSSSRRRRGLVVGAVSALALLLGVADRGLAPFAAFQDGSGVATVRPFSVASAPAGWQIRHQADYAWATQYFGADASYGRYLVWQPSPQVSPPGIFTAADRQSSVYADVVLTDDKGSLDAYNLQNCFLFHNYAITTSRRVDVGNGVTALLLNYSDPTTGARWATVSWAWPVDRQGQTYYERVALTSSLVTTAADADISPTDGLNGLLVDILNLVNGSHDDPRVDAVYSSADARLESDAVALIAYAIDHRR